MLIVINRNGRRVVLKGWRAWAIVLPVMFLVALVVLGVLALALGFAVTLITLILIALPIALVLALIASLFSPRPPTP